MPLDSRGKHITPRAKEPPQPRRPAVRSQPFQQASPSRATIYNSLNSASTEFAPSFAQDPLTMFITTDDIYDPNLNIRMGPHIPDFNNILAPPPSGTSQSANSPGMDIGTYYMGASPDQRAPREKRKRAYDHSTRLEQAARKAGEDHELQLAVLALSARTDTKNHSSNSPRFYASPSCIDAFRQVGIPCPETFLMNIVYGRENPVVIPQTVTLFEQENSRLVAELSAKEQENICLQEMVARLQAQLASFTIEAATLTQKMQESSSRSILRSSF